MKNCYMTDYLISLGEHVEICLSGQLKRNYITKLNNILKKYNNQMCMLFKIARISNRINSDYNMPLCMKRSEVKLLPHCQTVDKFSNFVSCFLCFPRSLTQPVVFASALPARLGPITATLH